MDLEAFVKSIAGDAPPAGLGHALAALWWDAKGDWTKAHGAAQADEGADGAWVHAYLHRKEGDERNAAHWYKRAGRAPATASLEVEWRTIAVTLLAGV